jgi:tetratricopeptide (TPR) repeat protein
MKFHWHISAGEFFELLRPSAIVVSALLSTWVLASARRWHSSLHISTMWALATFFLPFIILPLYLISRSAMKRRAATDAGNQTAAPIIRYRFVMPAAYGLALLSLIALYLHHDDTSVDAHLARAAQAKVMSQHARAINEYRAALALEDNAHTHKLLGIELAHAGQWAEGLNEFRAAERGGEPDDLLPFRIGQTLDALGRFSESLVEYKMFLNSHACREPLPDDRCAVARQREAKTSLRN